MAQRTLDEPFLHVSSDRFVESGMLPERRDRVGPFAWWEEMRPRFFDGFHRCLPALAGAGNDLLVEHVIEFAEWRQDLARLLAGFDVLLVGVHCELAEIDRRERERGDRWIGEGRSHVESDGIHTFGPYDYEVDASQGVTSALAQSVVTAWRARDTRRAIDAPG
ncbi:phosphotransferase-like protein [Nonomuraea sp. 3N208]|uniref:phosphotransferase-like protein n=1 Tax=Nonomuraea sp. 3N208 TaxID=3457421 RepID=UPI003FD0603A